MRIFLDLQLESFLVKSALLPVGTLYALQGTIALYSHSTKGTLEVRPSPYINHTYFGQDREPVNYRR